MQIKEQVILPISRMVLMVSFLFRGFFAHTAHHLISFLIVSCWFPASDVLLRIHMQLMKTDISGVQMDDGAGVSVTYLVHADISTLLHIPDRNSSFFETAFKTKAAAQIEAHHA